MDDRDHQNTQKRYRDAITSRRSITICENQNRNPREECSKYRDKPTNKYDKGKCKYKRKCCSAMKEAYDDKSYRSYNRIDESDDRLCLKYQSKPSSDLFCYHCPFIIEKSEISIFYLSEKFFYAFSVDNEEVRKYQCNKEFCQNNPSICDISDSFLSYCFQIV